MWEEEQGARTLSVAFDKLDRSLVELLAGTEGIALGLSDEQVEELVEDARGLVSNYFVLEDPNRVRVIGTELRLQVDMSAPAGDGDDGPVSRLRLRGIIDRLELDEQGELIVTDYKTGRAPGQSQEQARLGGVHFYALLCEQVLGRRPAMVQLFHLRKNLSRFAVPPTTSRSPGWSARRLRSGPPSSGHACSTTSGRSRARCAIGAATTPTARLGAATRRLPGWQQQVGKPR